MSQSQSNVRNQNTLLVMAGGTGGHVYPALAVANYLRSKDTKIAWLGTHRGLEARVVPQHNIELAWVSVEGLRGKGVISCLLAPFKLLRALWQSARAIREIKPDCVLGMGGFVAGPGGLAARIMRKPLVIHEQNAVAGLTNRYLAKIANKVLTGFPSVSDLPTNAQWVGNPVRKEIADIAKTDKQVAKLGEVKVLVIGGSQGAHTFNLHLPRLFKHHDADIKIWHQSGKGRASEVEQRYRDLQMDAEVSEFIEDMAEAYAWADLLVCRAGAMTIAECAAAGKPAILVPFPFSAGDHQSINAKALVDVGAALMLSNQELAEASSFSHLAQLLSNPEHLNEMGNKARNLYKPDAMKMVAQHCEEFLNA